MTTPDSNSYTSSLANSSTFVIKGRKRALSEAYNRSFNVNRSYYCITGDELVKSYKPFLPLLQNQVFRRGGSSYIITNIEKETIAAVRDLTEAGAEIRHIDISNLRRCVVYDDEVAYFSIIEPVITHTATDSVEQTEGEDLWVGSTELSVVQSAKKHYMSDWNKSVQAKQRIKEIEEGGVHYETRIIEDSNEIIKELDRLIASSNELYSCLTSGGIQYSYNHFFGVKKKILEKQKIGEHKGIRAVSDIDKGSAKLVKILVDAGIEMRHVKNLPPMSFALSDKELAATIEKMEGGSLVQSLLLSNESPYVNHFKSIFEDLWKDGIDAVERIKDLERGIQSDIEVIPNSARAKEVYLTLVKNAKEEILIIFPTSGAFIRQSKLGVIELAKEAARLRNVKMRILMPASSLTDQMIIDLKQDYPHNFDVRYHVEQTSAAKGTILVVDRKDSLVMELRDDSTSTFEEAIGFSTHSNSRPGVLSYVAIFENIWIQTEMFEELKVHERMQREFINVAAHELRTPIQPILSMTGILSSKKSEISKQELDQSIDLIRRNAERLKQLSEDILDVTKIESKTLELNKESVNLDEMVSNLVQDYRNQIGPIKLLYEAPEGNEPVYVEADKTRLIQVFHNLLSNAIKFTSKEGGGTISISLRQEKEGGDGVEATVGGGKNVIVSVRDSGTGIHPEIFPRLFEKFASKSYQGTGLGLFISKSIIEGHGGKIWAENNTDDKGAMFTFSLPISKRLPK